MAGRRAAMRAPYICSKKIKNFKGFLTKGDVGVVSATWAVATAASRDRVGPGQVGCCRHAVRHLAAIELKNLTDLAHSRVQRLSSS